MNPRPCRSAHRCNQITCQTCCWRSARHTTLRLLHSTGPLHIISLTIPDTSPTSFRAFCIECRNRIDYLRRRFPRWRKFGLHVWLQRDLTIQGIVSPGLLGTYEVQKGLKRWQAKLGKRVEPEDLRVAIWNVTKPSAILVDGQERGRYQSIKLDIWPCRVPVSPTHSCSVLSLQPFYEPMPVVL